MKKKPWLIVANSSLARIFTFEKRLELKELKVFEHPESRLHNIDLVSDRPGRDFESVGTTRHALEPKTSPKQLEIILFAKQLADYLEQEHNKGEFEVLYIAANPSLLGLLRQSLHPNITKLIKAETDKDLTQMKIHEIPDHLPFLF